MSGDMARATACMQQGLALLGSARDAIERTRKRAQARGDHRAAAELLLLEENLEMRIKDHRADLRDMEEQADWLDPVPVPDLAEGVQA